MIEYLCPNCNKDMDRRMDYVRCGNCKINYFTSTGNFYLEDMLGEIFYCGTFEECCRAYRMKVFS